MGGRNTGRLNHPDGADAATRSRERREGGGGGSFERLAVSRACENNDAVIGPIIK